MYNEATKQYRAGSAAPFRKNAREWLRNNPGWQLARGESPLPDEEEEEEEEGEEEEAVVEEEEDRDGEACDVDAGEERVVMRHAEHGVRSGSAAPKRKNAARWLEEHPGWSMEEPTEEPRVKRKKSGSRKQASNAVAEAAGTPAPPPKFGIGCRVRVASGEHEGLCGVVTVGSAGYWEVAVDATKAKGGKAAAPAFRQFFRRASLEVIAAKAGGAKQAAAAAVAAATAIGGRRRHEAKAVERLGKAEGARRRG